MTAVECSSKSGPYCFHVCAGSLASEPLTATNTSAGLRTTCTIQFTDAQAITSRTVPAITWTASGATRMASNARRARRMAERRARRPRMRVGRSAARAVIAWGMTDTHPLSSIQDRHVRSAHQAHSQSLVCAVHEMTSTQPGGVDSMNHGDVAGRHVCLYLQRHGSHREWDPHGRAGQPSRDRRIFAARRLRTGAGSCRVSARTVAAVCAHYLERIPQAERACPIGNVLCRSWTGPRPPAG